MSGLVRGEVDPVGLTGRERLLLAAERLIAEQGVGVSLREIALAAGQRNNSAVNYHFGDRDGLIAAIVVARLEALEPPRRALLAQADAEGRGDDLHALVAVLAWPMFDAPYQLGATHYARFLEAVRDHPSVRRLGVQRAPHNASVREAVARLSRALAHLPDSVHAWRFQALTTTLFALLADHEEVQAAMPLEAEVVRQVRDDVVHALVAILTAPLAPSVGGPSRG